MFIAQFINSLVGAINDRPYDITDRLLDKQNLTNLQKQPRPIWSGLKFFYYTIPCACIASATLTKPAMFAPAT